LTDDQKLLTNEYFKLTNTISIKTLVYEICCKNSLNSQDPEINLLILYHILASTSRVPTGFLANN